MKVLTAPTAAEMVVKKSRFLSEAIPVETVGSLQLGPSDTKEDLKGPYGKVTDAADDDEG